MPAVGPGNHYTQEVGCYRVRWSHKYFWLLRVCKTEREGSHEWRQCPPKCIGGAALDMLCACKRLGPHHLDWHCKKKSHVVISASQLPPPPVYLSRHIDATPVINAPFNNYFTHVQWEILWNEVRLCSALHIVFKSLLSALGLLLIDQSEFERVSCGNGQVWLKFNNSS